MGKYTKEIADLGNDGYSPVDGNENLGNCAPVIKGGQSMVLHN